VISISVSAIRSSSLISSTLVHDLSAAIVSVCFGHFAKLGDDDLLESLVACQNLAQLGDQFAMDFNSFKISSIRELRQPVQLQFEMASICA